MSDAAGASESGGSGYPARLDIEYPEGGLNRATTILRIILVIPILVVAGLLTNSFVGDWQGDASWAGFFVSITLFGPTLLMILFRQKYPRWWFDWNLELIGQQPRVASSITSDHCSIEVRSALPGWFTAMSSGRP